MDRMAGGEEYLACEELLEKIKEKKRGSISGKQETRTYETGHKGYFNTDSLEWVEKTGKSGKNCSP